MNAVRSERMATLSGYATTGAVAAVGKADAETVVSGAVGTAWLAIGRTTTRVRIGQEPPSNNGQHHGKGWAVDGMNTPGGSDDVGFRLTKGKPTQRGSNEASRRCGGGLAGAQMFAQLFGGETWTFPVAWTTALTNGTAETCRRKRRVARNNGSERFRSAKAAVQADATARHRRRGPPLPALLRFVRNCSLSNVDTRR